MIDARKITKRYGELVAVDNVSFGIGRGEIVGLLGHNGAGKTTIMKMITGYLEPSEGSIEIDGLSIDEHRLTVQEKIGYLPENCPVYRDMTVIEYLSYVADMRSISQERQASVIRDTIQRTRLEEKALSPISTLSKGYQQRVGVAQAILHSPQILVLDEPTNGLDPSQIHDMRSLIRQLAVNSTVIISTHILQEVQAVCDRVIIVLQGKVALDSRLDSLRQSNKIQVVVDKPKSEVWNTLKTTGIVRAIREIAGEHGRFAFQVEFEGEAKPQFAAQISSALVKNGFGLYEIYPEKRDLETVFREINTSRSL